MSSTDDGGANKENAIRKKRKVTHSDDPLAKPKKAKFQLSNLNVMPGKAPAAAVEGDGSADEECAEEREGSVEDESGMFDMSQADDVTEAEEPSISEQIPGKPINCYPHVHIQYRGKII